MKDLTYVWGKGVSSFMMYVCTKLMVCVCVCVLFINQISVNCSKEVALLLEGKEIIK